MKPHLDSAPLTREDVSIWMRVSRASTVGLIGAARIAVISFAGDHVDALIMLVRGVHLAHAALGRIRYWPPRKYWVPPDDWADDGCGSFEMRHIYTGDIPT